MMFCAPCSRRKRASRTEVPALESNYLFTLKESRVCEAGEEHSEGVWVSHDGQVSTEQTPRQRQRLQPCRAAARSALLEPPAVECSATAPPPSALLFTKDAHCPTAVERRKRTDQEDEISHYGPTARSSRSGFICSSCGCEQPSLLHLSAAASGEFVWTPGLPPLVKLTVLLYKRLFRRTGGKEDPHVHSIRLADRNPFPGSKLSVRVRLPWDTRMRHHEDEHGNHLLPVVQYFDTFSLLSCLRCLKKDQSPPLIRHWLLEPLSGCDPADRVHLALDFSYIRATNPPSGSSEKETVDNVTTFLLTVRDKRDGGCAEDRSGWRNRLQSLSIAQLLEVARALDIAECDLRSIWLRKSKNEDHRKDLVEMCMTHGSTRTGVFITALAKLDPESSVARTTTCPTQATDYEESASVPVPSAHPELREGGGEDSCTAPKEGRSRPHSTQTAGS